MKILRLHGIAWMAALGMCLPAPLVAREVDSSSAAAAADSRPGVLIHDVALAPGGLLVGQVLDETMRPVAGAAIEIQSHGQTTAATATDSSGVFAVTGLRGGLHQVATQDSVATCRLWSPGTAPPRAIETLRFVPGQDGVVRGQWGSPYGNSFAHNAKMWATNPWVIGGVIATAVAVPIIIHNLDDDKDNGS